MSLKQLLEYARNTPGYITLTDAAVKSFGGSPPSEAKFAYTDPYAEILSHKSIDQQVAKDFPDEAVALFDAVITDNRKDRDGDVLQSKGAKLVKRMPLLLGHDWDKVIGVMVRTLEHGANKISGRFAIADTAEGRDAAKLVRLRAFSISHGFLPEEFEPIKDKDGRVTGFEIKKFEIYETSLVAVPSNIRAVILDDYEKSFESDTVKTWAKSLYENRDKVFPGVELPTEKSLHYATPDFLEGSYESIRESVLKESCEHLGRRDCYAYSIGTFDGHAIIGMYDYDDGENKAYRINYSLSKNVVSITGSEEVEVDVTVTSKQKAKALEAGIGVGPIKEVAVEEPAAETADEPAAETAEEPSIETTEEPAAETAEETTVETTEEPVAEATDEPVAEATDEPVAEATEEPVAEATEETPVETTEEPLATEVAEALTTETEDDPILSLFS